jgi:hypothetical protein
LLHARKIEQVLSAADKYVMTGERRREAKMALLDLEDGAEAVNWHIEVSKTHPPKVKLTALIRSPSDPPVPITPLSDKTIRIEMAPEVAQELSDLLGRVLNPA